MTTAAPYIAKWGILGAGGISSTFARDLALPRPEVTDVLHAVVAVGSKDTGRGQQFIDANLPKGGTAQQAGYVKEAPKAVSYAELFADPNVKIVYIGTLHQQHHDDVTAALNAGKHVLVEKPAVLNAAEWADLSALAKKKNLFLMEALWTRFQPAVLELHRLLHEEKVIGEIRDVRSSFFVENYNVLPDDHRVVSYEAAGGPLLDVGAYCMIPARVALQDNPLNRDAKPVVTTAMSKTRMGSDLATTLVLDYPSLDARATCSMNWNARAPRDAWATIVGTKGEIVIHDGLYRIARFTVHRLVEENADRKKAVWEEDRVELDFAGTGLHLEADAVARDVRDGKIENDRVPHSETLLTMEIFDQARREGGYVLPEGMEKIGRVGA